MNGLIQKLPCGCEPDRGFSCRQHRFEKAMEARLEWRFLRGEGTYRDYKRVHDARINHHRKSRGMG